MGKGREKEIVNYLNKKKYKDLYPVWQTLCKEINPEVDQDYVITAEEIGGNFKADLKIKVGDKEAYISAKNGSGNSVHQEPLPTFLNFCKNELSAVQEILDAIRWFICERKSANQLYKERKDTFGKLNAFFEKNLKSLLERFLITGLYNENTADYIYYGDIEKGVFTNLHEAIELIVNRNQDTNLHPFLKNDKNLYVGPLTFQAWNRNISGDPSKPSEKKRGHIQLKWGTVKRDIEYINRFLSRD